MGKLQCLARLDDISFALMALSDSHRLIESVIHGFNGSHNVINGSNSAYCSKDETKFSQTFDVFKHRRSI